jgi:DNA-binding NarL/FixJ family response regulator
LSSFRVALIDGDDAIRSGKRWLIDSQQDMKVVYEEAQASKALTDLPELLVDVVVIDHRLQGMDGIALSRKLIASIRESEQLVPTIVITGAYFTFELLMASIRAGATELVTQDTPSEKLLEAIRKSKRNMAEVKLKPFADFLDANSYEPEIAVDYLLKLSQLSTDERELVDAIVLAEDLEEIASRLSISRSRIRELLENTMRVFGCATIEQLYLVIRDSSKRG